MMFGLSKPIAIGIAALSLVLVISGLIFKTAEGCEALLRWNKAAGITFPGLTRRRQKERQFCLEGL